MHVAEISPENPALQAGEQVVPATELGEHVPAPALSTTGRPAQAELVHAPEVVHEPALQVAKKKSVLHSTKKKKSSGFFQKAGKSCFRKRVVKKLQEKKKINVPVRVPVNPERQVGTHEVPAALLTVQFPASASWIVGRDVQVDDTQVPAKKNKHGSLKKKTQISVK